MSSGGRARYCVPMTDKSARRGEPYIQSIMHFLMVLLPIFPPNSKGLCQVIGSPFCHPERSRGISAVSGIVSLFETPQQQQRPLDCARGDNKNQRISFGLTPPALGPQPDIHPIAVRAVLLPRKTRQEAASRPRCAGGLVCDFFCAHYSRARFRAPYGALARASPIRP